MATSLKNVNVISAYEVKTVCIKIDLKIYIKISHGEINHPFKRLILFIK